MTSAQEKNEQVLKVLANSARALTPSEIAASIRQPWCMPYGDPCSHKISPVLKRIGAFSPTRGRWLHPSRAKGGTA